ncbi:MAG: hypothetical protein F6K10_27180 [Moorea sp. SIO2B7]|nr:hypothetical protein [Moorena sp. SIO2B7]
MIHPLVGSAYLGVPKQINLSVALPTLHLLPIPDSRFPIPVPLLGGVRGGFRFPIPDSQRSLPNPT